MTGKRLKNFLAILIMLGIFGVSAAFLRNQYDTIAELERQIARTRRDIEEQMITAESLLSERNAFGTAEFYERIARERLGLGFRNEVLIRMR
jgi:cell division protein FtsB